jgi:hypothetical protein
MSYEGSKYVTLRLTLRYPPAECQMLQHRNAHNKGQLLSAATLIFTFLFYSSRCYSLSPLFFLILWSILTPG